MFAQFGALMALTMVGKPDGTIIADRPGSPSLDMLRAWLDRWEAAGRPGVDAYTATLVAHDGGDFPGWDLRAQLTTALSTAPARDNAVASDP
ncbi:hypothetical protein DMB66_18495 [Actinoplanes sp. ATCC 53533]|uniref:hypothetical protein n=1 Tax=Actinoplanes sp. ATCC 53533 TaxID=1288362 RepID=UPI000F7AAB40|nr:hypothetical protein [Actinoplanes sp. ATCC 53533]RSM64904.1 hypothetical protein DMB66_18495 [Actinoplanes sp. ATCC 53533]